MFTLIFLLTFATTLVLSTMYINPYLFPVWLITSYIIAFLMVLFFLILNLPIVFMLKANNKYKSYLMQSLSYFLCKVILNLKVEVEGLDNIPKDGPLVAYSNHKSYTDAFAILPYFNRPLTLTPKKTVLKIAFIRTWLKAYDIFPIDRTNPRETLKDLQKAVETVKNGHAILFFPEGTIKGYKNEKVENVKAGAFRLVKDAHADILPILLQGNELVRKRWPRQTKRKVVFYPTIPYESFKDLRTQEIAQIYMDTINK